MITGQLFDTSSPELFGSDVQMALWDGHLSFVLLKTNEWGEFLGEIENSCFLSITLQVDVREIVISIQNVLG